LFINSSSTRPSAAFRFLSIDCRSSWVFLAFSLVPVDLVVGLVDEELQKEVIFFASAHKQWERKTSSNLQH